MPQRLANLGSLACAVARPAQGAAPAGAAVRARLLLRHGPGGDAEAIRFTWARWDAPDFDSPGCSLTDSALRFTPSPVCLGIWNETIARGLPRRASAPSISSRRGHSGGTIPFART